MQIWMLVAVLAIIVIGFGLALRHLMRKSREAESKIDYSKIRHLEDEQ